MSPIDSPLLGAAASVLARLDKNDQSAALPLIPLVSHVVLSLLGGLFTAMLWRCQRVPVSKFRLFAYMMRVQKELQPTTMIAAATIAIGNLAHPDPMYLRVLLVFVATVFALVGYGVYGLAFLRFQLSKVSSDRHALLSADTSIAAEDAAVCFFLNGLFSTASMTILRNLLLASLLATTALAAANPSTHLPYAIVGIMALLFFLVLSAAAHHMRPAITTPGFPRWDHKDYQRAVQQRASSGESASSPSKDGPGDGLDEPGSAACCSRVREVTSVLMPRPARDVVLEESTKLTWADHRFNSIGELAPSAARGIEVASEDV